MKLASGQQPGGCSHPTHGAIASLVKAGGQPPSLLPARPDFFGGGVGGLDLRTLFVCLFIKILINF